MLVILSPAKSLNFDHQVTDTGYTVPVFSDETAKLVKILQGHSPAELVRLMSVSHNLAALNHERYQTWNTDPEKSKQAILAFDGDVYDGLTASTLNRESLLSSQNRVRILSGLYGVLKPLDLIQPHRLEMGTKLRVNKAKNLYEFWKSKIVSEINKSISESGNNILINLASGEYFKSIDTKRLRATIIAAQFRDQKDGNYRIMSFYAKRARGMMTRFILENNISDPEDLKAFDLGGYHFSPRMSSDETLVFIREH
jgi:uncharacterized protein